MRLCGAAEILIRLPLLLQGMFQGLVGALLALALLITAHRLIAPHLDPVLNLTVGLPHLYFLPAWNLGMLLIAGTLLGGLGGYLGRGATR